MDKCGAEADMSLCHLRPDTWLHWEGLAHCHTSPVIILTLTLQVPRPNRQQLQPYNKTYAQHLCPVQVTARQRL